MLIYWLAAGVVLIVLEFVIPGGVAVFLGIAALLVCLLIWAGFVDGHMAAFTAWFILSLLLLVSLRGLVQRMMPGDQSWQSTDEDADAYGTIVEVAETIENAAEGRIHFRGSTWARDLLRTHAEQGRPRPDDRTGQSHLDRRTRGRGRIIGL